MDRKELIERSISYLVVLTVQHPQHCSFRATRRTIETAFCRLAFVAPRDAIGIRRPRLIGQSLIIPSPSASFFRKEYSVVTQPCVAGASADQPCVSRPARKKFQLSQRRYGVVVNGYRE